MKKTGSRRKVYVCRKCGRQDFRNMMAFTQHLRKCRVVDVPVVRILRPTAPAPVTNGMKAELRRLQKLASEMQDLTVKLLGEAK